MKGILMKTLLYLNNYTNTIKDFEKVKQMEYPAHHLWGADFLEKHFRVILPAWHITTIQKTVL
jgi:hypothetical protein